MSIIRNKGGTAAQGVSSEDGTHLSDFLVAPHHRLFAVFADPKQGTRALEEIDRQYGADDRWILFGQTSWELVDRAVTHPRLLARIVRAILWVLSNDSEYIKGLSAALHRGEFVLAIKIDRKRVEEAAQILRRYGGHELAYGDHLNFEPLAGSSHTVGDFIEEVWVHAEGPLASEATLAAFEGDGTLLGAIDTDLDRAEEVTNRFASPTLTGTGGNQT